MSERVQLVFRVSVTLDLPKGKSADESLALIQKALAEQPHDLARLRAIEDATDVPRDVSVSYIGSILLGSQPPCGRCAQPWGACECSATGAPRAKPDAKAAAKP